MKHLPFLFIVCTLLSIPPVSTADTIRLKNGKIITGVVYKETAATIDIQIELGKISILRDEVQSFEKSSKEANDSLLAHWRSKRIKEKKVTNPSLKTRDGERLMKYQSKWITLEEYEALKKQHKEAQETQAKAAQTQKEDTEKKRRLDELIHETRERIVQGRSLRSLGLHTLLSSGTWLSTKTTHFVIYTQGEELTPLIPHFVFVTEHYYETILKDLDLAPPFSLKKPIELVLVTDPTTWKKHCESLGIGDSPGYARYDTKELCMDARNEKKTIRLFVHELSTMILTAFLEQNNLSPSSLPLWAYKGFAHYEGPLEQYELPHETLIDALYKNYALKLDTLLITHTVPTASQEAALFYTQASLLIEFIRTTYGPQELSEFLQAHARTYRTFQESGKALTKKDARTILLSVLKLPFLKKDFSGYASFDEAWQRWMAQGRKTETPS